MQTIRSQVPVIHVTSIITISSTPARNPSMAAYYRIMQNKDLGPELPGSGTDENSSLTSTLSFTHSFNSIYVLSIGLDTGDTA